MKFKLLAILLFFTFLTSQDRSTIFTTYTGDDPDPSLGGYNIEHTNSSIYGAADKFFISNEYVLERIYVYLSFESENAFEVQQIEVKICEDNQGKPGNPLSNSIITLNPSAAEGNWYAANLLNDCIKTEVNTNYWIVVLPLENTNAQWIYSTSDSFIYSLSSDGGDNWSDEDNGAAGTAYLTAEQVYVPPFYGGDINGDFIVNVLDIVSIVNYVLGNVEFNEDQLIAADLTQDGGINILDIITLVNIIINSGEIVSEFLYEDINTNSATFEELVGPSVYNGMISLYYFGKAGWSMCRNRFGVLNDLYNELVNEGINDVKIMGINGYQYINDSYSCMICDDDCTTCSEPRILPWTQDIDYNEDGDGDVWTEWDAILRDLVIIGRDGQELARINLTYNNPDPNSTCGENYDTIKNLILSFR